ncbi:aminotransferase class IV [Desulfosarcina sp. OttesenSCG-928-A07]|nr:aminotransferase class IV [Desulfosarcina sp. OttesenSCG-928-G17]MDL2329364.1 aminotransferase class IV [Desulfosarcina sp. OttesenSCG-928-A07]
MPIYYVDGEFVPAESAVIPVDDLAILRGIGVFDLLRTRNGVPCFLDAHIRRLENSARAISLPLPWSHDEIAHVVRQTLEKNNLPEASIRVLVTGGSSHDFMTPSGNPRLVVMVTPVSPLPETWYVDGVKIISQKVERALPGAKSINYIQASLALKKADSVGALDALYVDPQEMALECTTSNIFAFSGNTLITPERNILHGITRQMVMELAAEHFTVSSRDLPYSELISADEVFITNTPRGIVPVTQVDDHPIGDSRPGNRTRNLMAAITR